MKRWQGWCSGLSVIVAAALAGCGDQKHDWQTMAPPPRAAELDRLDKWVGSWESTGECTMAGAEKPMKCTGKNTVAWDCDNRVLVEHFEGQMEGSDSKFKGIGIWTWDSRMNKYRIWWFDSFGEASDGVATYNEKEDIWNFHASGRNPMTGKPSYMTGTMKMTSPSTMEWTHKEWDNQFRWGTPTMDMKATSRKR
jgi:hypothetical protein